MLGIRRFRPPLLHAMLSQVIKRQTISNTRPGIPPIGSATRNPGVLHHMIYERQLPAAKAVAGGVQRAKIGTSPSRGSSSIV